MENIEDFFDFINNECLMISININEDWKVGIKWEKITADDYIATPQTINKINIRVQKIKNGAFFIDCFQNYNNNIHWSGFHMRVCSHYEMNCDENNLFDADFYFDNNKQLCIHKINMEVVFALQNFFSGLI